MSDQKIISPGTLINGYEVESLIGIGGYANIYKVKDIKSNQLYAMKTEYVNSVVKTLPLEIQCMKQLKEDFFPKFQNAGYFDEYKVNYYVTDLLGASLDTIQIYHRKKLDMETVYNVCFNMLLIIQAFHSYGYVHRDIKPGNFLIQENEGCPLVLIDFGVCQQHIDPNTNKPFPRGEETYFFGTERYASIDACRGYTQSRKDDLMSWFYSFLDLACGYLPWDDAKDFTDMLFIKKFFNIDYLNRKFPKEMNDIYKYIKKLDYDDDPNYEYILQLFVKAMEADHFSIENYNWHLFYRHHQYLESLTRLISLKRYKKESQYKRIQGQTGEKSNPQNDEIENLNGHTEYSHNSALAVLTGSLLKGDGPVRDVKSDDIICENHLKNPRSSNLDENNNNIVNNKKASVKINNENDDKQNEKDANDQPVKSVE